MYERHHLLRAYGLAGFPVFALPVDGHGPGRTAPVRLEPEREETPS